MCVFVEKVMKNVNEPWNYHQTKVNRDCSLKWGTWQWFGGAGLLAEVVVECVYVWILSFLLPWWPAVWSGRSQTPSCFLYPPLSGLSGRGSSPDATAWCRSRGQGWSWVFGSASCLDCRLFSACSLHRQAEELSKGKKRRILGVQHVICHSSLEFDI